MVWLVDVYRMYMCFCSELSEKPVLAEIIHALLVHKLALYGARRDLQQKQSRLYFFRPQPLIESMKRDLDKRRVHVRQPIDSIPFLSITDKEELRGVGEAFRQRKDAHLKGEWDVPRPISLFSPYYWSFAVLSLAPKCR